MTRDIPAAAPTRRVPAVGADGPTVAEEPAEAGLAAARHASAGGGRP